MIENILKVIRALSQPFSNVILVSLEGLGKQAISRLSIFLLKYDLVELSAVMEFERGVWKEHLKEAVLRISEDEDKRRVFNIIPSNFTQDDSILVDLNCLLKNGEISSLLVKEELNTCMYNVRSAMRDSSMLKQN
jgi:hypothetical protein